MSRLCNLLFSALLKEMMFSKLLLDKEMDVAGNIDKNVFEIMTLPNNLVLICRVKDYDLVFFSLYDS